MSTETDVGLELEPYKWGFSKPENYVFKARKGLSHEIVNEISEMKSEPQWMRDFRLKASTPSSRSPMPTWGGDLSAHRLRRHLLLHQADSASGKTWDDVPAEIKNTFEQLGIPEAERKYLAGVGAQYESEVVYHKAARGPREAGRDLRRHRHGLARARGPLQQVLRHDHPAQRQQVRRAELARSGAAAASSTCPRASGSRSRCRPTSASTRENMGQFERTLIIAEEAPMSTTSRVARPPCTRRDSLH